MAAGRMRQAGCFFWRGVRAVVRMAAWVLVTGEAFGLLVMEVGRARGSGRCGFWQARQLEVLLLRLLEDLGMQVSSRRAVVLVWTPRHTRSGHVLTSTQAVAVILLENFQLTRHQELKELHPRAFCSGRWPDGSSFLTGEHLDPMPQFSGTASLRLDTSQNIWLELQIFHAQKAAGRFSV